MNYVLVLFAIGFSINGLQTMIGMVSWKKQNTFYN